MNILIVDDSANLRHIIKKFVSTAFKDARLQEAGNGEEAMKLLQESSAMGAPIDIVILDWMMPKLSGFEFLKEMRETDVFKDSPEVIMLTAETYSTQINAALKYRVSSYITKPFTSDDLSQAITKVITMKGMKNAV